jgi:alpha-D-xyloside xylohydrolase
VQLAGNTFERIKNVENSSQVSNKISLDCRTNKENEVEVRLFVFEHDILRIQMIPKLALEKAKTLLEIMEPRAPKHFEFKEQSDLVKITTGSLVITIQKDPWNLSITDKSNRVVFAENSEDINTHGVRTTLPLGYFEDREGKVVGVNDSFTLSADEHFYGLGEKFTELDKKGRTIVCWNINPFGVGTEEAYKNIPFVISTQGYGIFLNSTYRSEWKLGSESNMSYTIFTEDPKLDLFLIYGPQLKKILSKYSGITGKPSMPPLWSLGAWYTVHIWDDVRELEELCKKFGEHDLLSNLIMIEWDFRLWMGNVRERGPLEWNNQSIPVLKEIVRILKKYDKKLILCESPYVDKSSETFEELKQRGFLVRDNNGSTLIENLGYKYVKGLDQLKQDKTKAQGLGIGDIVKDSEKLEAQGMVSNRFEKNWRERHVKEFYTPVGFFDFTNPDAVAWWKDMHKKLINIGVQAYFCDFGEDVPVYASFHNGKTGKEMHNIYQLLYQKTTYECFEETGKEGILCNRSGYAGSQKCPIHWSGDPASTFLDMVANIRAGQSLGMSGVPFWSHDTGGFKGFPTPELFIRWLQFSIFSPFIRFHGALKKKGTAQDYHGTTTVRPSR